MFRTWFSLMRYSTEKRPK
uniref:Uncharacterized protein n=1 Tax=Anguilla anguilla TaxID=7936 RepID=A0A0E9QWH3_ANGAN